MNIIKKLIERNIFKVGTLIDAPVKKHYLGTPIILTKTLRVKQIQPNHCVADEEYDIDVESYNFKIHYNDISKVDGMVPQELAAVYGLAPKTERFKRKKLDK